MERPTAEDDLVITTPELVAFDYQVAGLATRGLAQLIDFLIVLALWIGLIIAAAFIGLVVQDVTLLILIYIIGTFVLFFGYFWAFETFWSGQTLGKRVFRLRVVGDQGEPVTFTQSAVRNLVRLIDFLPSWYGIGLVVLFVNGKGKRLGDLAAGTLVVKDSDRISLRQLSAFTPPVPANAPIAAASPSEQTLRRLDPDLRRFVSSYAHRRYQLTPELRLQLAGTVQPKLKTAFPELVAQRGPLAALDYLADLDQGSS